MSPPKQPKPPEMPKGFLALSVIDRAFDLATTLIWAGVFVAIAYTIFLCIRELAGHDTVAQFVVGYLSNGKGGASAKPWMATTALAAAWGGIEKWLRGRKVGSMSQRIKDLERMIDANRSSSGLTRTGQVPKRGKKDD